MAYTPIFTKPDAIEIDPEKREGHTKGQVLNGNRTLIGEWSTQDGIRTSVALGGQRSGVVTEVGYEDREFKFLEVGE